MIFLLAVPSSAAEFSFYPYQLCVSYQGLENPNSTNGSNYTSFDMFTLFGGNNYLSGISSVYYEDETSDYHSHEASCLSIQYYNSDASDGRFQFTEGMIYTFSGEFYVNSSSTNIYGIDFVLTNYSFVQTRYIPDLALYYSIATRAGRQTVTWEAVFEVPAESELVSPSFEEFKYISVEIGGSFEGNIRVQNMNCKVIDSYGEDAFYDANISALQDLKSATEDQTLQMNEAAGDIVESNERVESAINNMWENEYLYVENAMPDSLTDVEDITGGIEAINTSLETLYYGQLFEILTIGMAQSRPVLYIPDVDIPFLNINAMKAGFFYVDTELDKLNPNIMSTMNVLVVFIRWTTLVTICTVTIYKLYRLEWWT